VKVCKSPSPEYALRIMLDAHATDARPIEWLGVVLVLGCWKLSPEISQLQITGSHRSGDDYHDHYQHDKHVSLAALCLTNRRPGWLNRMASPSPSFFGAH
jgi:hypothetical protein